MNHNITTASVRFAFLCFAAWLVQGPGAAWSQQSAKPPALPAVAPAASGVPARAPAPIPPFVNELPPLDQLIDELGLEEELTADAPAASKALQPELERPETPKPSEPIDWEQVEQWELETRLRNEQLLRNRAAVMEQWLQRSNALLHSVAIPPAVNQPERQPLVPSTPASPSTTASRNTLLPAAAAGPRNAPIEPIPSAPVINETPRPVVVGKPGLPPAGSSDGTIWVQSTCPKCGRVRLMPASEK